MTWIHWSVIILAIACALLFFIGENYIAIPWTVNTIFWCYMEARK